VEVFKNEVCCPMTPRLMLGRVPIVSTGAVAQVCACVGSPSRFSLILGVVSCSGSCFRRSSPAAIALDFKPGKLKPSIGVGPNRLFRASPETLGDRPTDRERHSGDKQHCCLCVLNVAAVCKTSETVRRALLATCFFSGVARKMRMPEIQCDDPTLVPQPYVRI